MNEVALLAAVQASIDAADQPHLPDGLTVQEMLAKTPDSSHRVVQRAVNRMVAEGAMIAGWKYIRDVTGRRQRVPAYQLKE